MSEIHLSEKGATKKFWLIPTLRAAMLGEQCYFYDSRSKQNPVVSIPTQKVPERAYHVVQTLQQVNPRNEPRTIEDIKEVFSDPKDISAVDVLVRSGYLEEYKVSNVHSPAEDEQSETPLQQKAETFQMDRTVFIEDFYNTGIKHVFNPPRLFNTPDAIEDKHVDVGCIGVPFSSNPYSVDAASAPTYLRTLSRRRGFWFDIYQYGIFSELDMDGALPSLLCKGVMLKDYGDLGANVHTVGDLFTEIQRFIEDIVLPHQIRPMFLGGDHAITFPIVDTFIKHYPEICVLHLDAHSDLFYVDRIRFNHSAPISNLLFFSGLANVYSFGLRNGWESRMQNYQRISQTPQLAERLHLYSIGALKRLLTDRSRFETLLGQIGPETPCYLSLDLDVLSPHEIGNQLSTPCGPGLEWWELYEILTIMFSQLKIIACDVVEFNLSNKNQTEAPDAKLSLLFLHLIDGLSRCCPPSHTHKTCFS